MQEQTSAKKKARRFFAVTLILSVLIAILNWGVITGWGNVRIERIYVNGYDGDLVSALIYIPENATAETPAPLMFCIHGNAGNARNHESWAVEFSRRGFVVICPDLYGAGDSENSAEQFAALPFLMSTAEAFYEEALTYDFVDTSNILISAHSMGGSVAAGLAGKYQPKAVLSASGQLGSQFRGVEGAETYTDGILNYTGNVLLDFGDAEGGAERVLGLVQDWLDARESVYHGAQYTELGTVAGSFEEGNAVVGMCDYQRVHEAAFVRQSTIGNLVWFAQEVVGEENVPNYIDSTNQIWMYKDWLGLAGILVYGLFICALALLLIEEVPAFAAVKRPVARNIGLRGIGLAISITLGIVLPFVVLKTNAFGLISAFGWSKLPPETVNVPGLRLTYANVALGTIIGFNVCGLAGYTLYRFTDGRKHKLQLQDLGLTPDGTNKLSFEMIGKTILLSALVVAIAWAGVKLQEDVLGTSFYAWFFGFKSIPIYKIKHYIAYIVIWIICFLVASLTLNVERRLPSTGKETLDIVIAMAFNILCATFTLVVAISANWILSSKGIEAPWLFTYNTDVTRLWGMPAGMAVGVGGSTLLYRKTGNAWLSAILMGTVAALMACTFGSLRIFS